MPTVNIGDVWIVQLTDTTGHEQSGSRPAIVLAVHDQTSLCMVVPLTSSQTASRFPFTYTITRSSQNGLSADSIAMVFQLRSLSINRLLRRIGTLESSHLRRIKMLARQYLSI